MNKYAIITENVTSNWEDIKGEFYHFPNTYRNILIVGCKFIYYKGKLKDIKFKSS